MITEQITIGCDHAGVALKNQIIEYLKTKGVSCIDVGTYTEESCDYPVYADKVCKNIQSGVTEYGILICGTGIGMSICANKHKGIRSAVCSDVFSARLTRAHNNANVLCFGARVVGYGVACDLADAFLSTSYEGGKHEKRVQMMMDMEKNG